MEHLYFIFQNIWNRIGNVRPSDFARYRGRGVIWIFPLLITALFFISISHAEVKAKEEVSKNDAAKSQAQVTYGNLPLYFIQNDGQVDEKVKFYEKGSGHATFITKEGVYISLVSGQTPPLMGEGKGGGDIASEAKQSNISSPDTSIPPFHKGGQGGITSELIKLTFLDANPNPEIVAEGVQEGKVNYFIGNDPKKWRTNIPTHQAVLYKEVYPGINIKFYGNNRQLEYDIIVKPGADPSKVRLAYEGIEGLRITENGDLEIILKEGKIVQKKPVVYQEIDGRRVAVSGTFKMQSHANLFPNLFAYSFDVASYDKNQPLIIDPTLIYSTYLGGSSDDLGMAIAVDGLGNIYLTGETNSSNFPTANALQPTHGGGFYDVFVAKINEAGTALVYSTYLGGGSDDVGHGIAVDGSGNAYVTGQTNSSNFPTANAVQPVHGGGISDAFAAKLNAAGTALVYSTYLGGGSGDYSNSIVVDGLGNAYVTGQTSSSNFPTANALQPTFGGVIDAFVTKINTTGTALDYSTYLGGSDNDQGAAITVDSSGDAYVTGSTFSSNFPTANALQPAFGGGAVDAFVSRLNAAATALVYSTYLGGSSGGEWGYGIAVDGLGNAYVTGATSSSNFPTVAPVQPTHSGGIFDAFVSKLNAGGTALVYSTYLGGSGNDVGRGIAVDGFGNAYVSGDASSSNFPTVNTLQPTFAGAVDAFVSKLNVAGTALTYSTYLGGNSYDYGYGITVDGSGNAYVMGATSSADFPITNTLQPASNGGYDSFISKVSSFSVALPRTGQTTCYDSAGAVIACPGTGQDGEIQAGVPWPNPRFTDNVDGTVTDNLTGLMWTQDANAPGPVACSPATAKTWQGALDYVACLNANSYLSYADWRLPNINELESLVNSGPSGTAAWLNTEGFSNVWSVYYWSSTSYAGYPSYAFVVYMLDGFVYAPIKSNSINYYVWPVRSGQSLSVGSSVVQLPVTGQTTSYAEGDDGAIRAGIGWPSPRFTDNGNSTVTDNLTGLVWSKDANAPGPAVCSPGTTKTWQGALDYVACINNNAYLGYTDWRLTNRKELHSLTDFSRYIPALPSGHPFLNVQWCDYWSSTTYAFYTLRAWAVNMCNCGIYALYDNTKSFVNFVWPVRSGQVGNTSPVLSYTSDAGYGSDGIDTDSGTASTSFTYKVVYTDADNNAPSFIKVHIDGDSIGTLMNLDASAVSTLRDGNYANGEQYYYTITLIAGIHDYYFTASDGIDTVRLPSSGTLSGPTVSDLAFVEGWLLPSGTVGISYVTLLPVSGGTPPYTWSIPSGLPPGLTLDSSTGFITGTPTTQGTYGFTAYVTDSNSYTYSRAFSIIIDPGCILNTYFQDADNDTYGDVSVTTQTCTQPSGYVLNSSDCNDGNASINPDATEVCNSVDDNCNSQVDEGVQNTYYQDADSDTYGNASVTTQACTVPSGYVSNGVDCNDSNASINPGAAEACNGVDDNCNGLVDEGAQNTYYSDVDNDTYGNASVTTQACTQPSGYVSNSSDCNDGNASINPGAAEVCNGVDDNCNGQTDEGVQNTYYQDVDNDTYGNASVTTQACTQPSGYVSDNTDCNDGDASINSGTAEVCNGVDDNCNGQVDEGVQNTYYRDADADTYGNASVTTQTCTQPAGYVTNSSDCNDGNSSINPGVTEVCNGVDDNCNAQIDEGYNQDGDGYTTCAGDCNDNNASIYPGATEICNGVDDNCNTLIDEGGLNTYYRDADNDAYGNSDETTQACSQPSGYVTNSTDCNDGSASINPAAIEVCNGVDDNCNAQIDEGVQNTYYRDADNDTYGNASVSTQACTQPSGYVTSSSDCNDSNASINPGAAEVCNGVDDNCNSQTDEGVQNTYYQDADNDAYGNVSVITQACTAPSGYVANSADCNDSNVSINPGATEVCNGVDDNCNSQIDEGVQNTYYRDADSDTYGNALVTTQACTQPSGYASNTTDCNDGNASINPGATEICNSIDDNCDGLIDESCAGVEVCDGMDNDNDGQIDEGFPDTDGDGNADCVDTDDDNDGVTDVNEISAGSDPLNPASTPEGCDGVDNDLDGLTDEGCPGSPATPEGTNVEVIPTENLTLTFDNVTTSGTTTVTTSGTGQPPPSGFRLGSPPVYYDITTTATYSGPIQVCLSYDETQFATERNLRLFHLEGGIWVDITDPGYPDTTNNIICGNTTSFSPFIVVEELSTAVTLQNISAHLDGNQVILNWSTSFEVDNEGFIILRAESAGGPFTPITQGMIPAMGGSGKATYTFADSNIEQGKTYYYQLQDIDSRGRVTAHQIIPVTVEVARKSETPQGDTGQGNNMGSVSQQSGTVIGKDTVGNEIDKPGSSPAWTSVVMSDDMGKSSVVETDPAMSPLEGAITAREVYTGNASRDAKEATVDMGTHQQPLIETHSNEVEPLNLSTGTSSFFVSIEDDKGNIIMVSKIENLAGTSFQSSGFEVNKESGRDGRAGGQSDRLERLSLQVKEESGRIVLTWEGRGGVRGFILHRAEKGKDNYTPITSLIPYFGRNDKDIFLYRFTDNSAKSGFKYEYRLERVDADHKPDRTIGKLSE